MEKYKTKIAGLIVSVHKVGYFSSMEKTPYYVLAWAENGHIECLDQSFGYIWSDGTLRMFASNGVDNFGGWYSSMRKARAAIAKFRFSKGDEMDKVIYTTKIGERTVALYRCKDFNPSPRTFKCKEAYYITVNPSRNKFGFSDYLWNDGTVHSVATSACYEGWYATIKAARAAITKFRKLSKVSV